MDKQTCAALLAMIGFDSYDMNFDEFTNDTTMPAKDFSKFPVFLLKTNAHNRVGSQIDRVYNQIFFKTYDDMLTQARGINETRKKYN